MEHHDPHSSDRDVDKVADLFDLRSPEGLPVSRKMIKQLIKELDEIDNEPRKGAPPIAPHEAIPFLHHSSDE